MTTHTPPPALAGTEPESERPTSNLQHPTSDAEKSYAVQSLEERRAMLERLLAMQEPMERIIARLPRALHYLACAAREWIQISSPSRAQTVAVMEALRAGQWTKKVSTGDSACIDYMAMIDGVEVTIYQAPPPASCRIAEETIEVPAHTKVLRKIVCIGSEVAA